MKRKISRVAVIGSGVMGSAIACHFANIGVSVLLLDVAPQELTPEELKKGLSESHPAFRNRLVNDNLAKALRAKPAPLYHAAFASRIQTGNLNDDLEKIAQADWIIEVIVERLDSKKTVFEQVEKYRTPGTLVTSNTSGIPIAFMNEGRSDDFRQHFAITHFFNPPRYLKLLEVIPGPDCKPEVADFLMGYGEKFLGKTTVLAKDTPAFIGNRIGIFGIQSLFYIAAELGLRVEDIDQLTGPILGRPKSATFRTMDMVGLDTLAHVAKGLYENCPGDEARELFKLPAFVQEMLARQWLGNKSGQGFYKKESKGGEKAEYQVLDLATLSYRPAEKAVFETVERAKNLPDLSERLKVLVTGTDVAGTFYQKQLGVLFAYIQNRIPEIADELYRIDDAMKAGFNWEKGPFELWDALGVEKGVALLRAQGHEPAEWVTAMLKKGISAFYTLQDGALYYYDCSAQTYLKKPGQEGYLVLDALRATRTVWQNAEAVVEDLGDGILNLEFRSKMNAIGGGVLEGIYKALDLAERDFQGLVISNQGANFSVGANLGLVFMLAVEQEYEELHAAVAQFQEAAMRLRYAAVPTVAAPHAMTLGGGCELCLHTDAVVAAAETYMGLVEFGVGLIPGGGGTKEMTLRASDSFHQGDVELNVLREYFLTMATANVSGSAYEAFETGLLQRGRDAVVVQGDRRLTEAKKRALRLAEAGYTKPLPRTIKALGKQALGMFLAGTDAMKAGKYISEHDAKIANKLAYVMTGGDLSEATRVSEQYLLDLEREAFLSLCGEPKTLERIQYMLKTGKPLRN